MNQNKRILTLVLGLLLLFSFKKEKQNIEVEIMNSISNTRWLYKADSVKYEIEFLAQGQLKTSNPEDKTPINDTWKVKKSKIIFYYNDHFIKHKVRMVNDSTMEGFGYNAEGRWKIRLEKLN